MNQGPKEWVSGFRKAFQKEDTQEYDGREEDDLAEKKAGEKEAWKYFPIRALCFVFVIAIHFWKAKESRTNLRIIGRSLHHGTAENINALGYRWRGWPPQPKFCSLGLGDASSLAALQAAVTLGSGAGGGAEQPVRWQHCSIPQSCTKRPTVLQSCGRPGDCRNPRAGVGWEG